MERTREKTEQEKRDEMTIAQAWEILQTWRECMNKDELSELSDFSDRNAFEVQYVPPTGIM